MNIKHIEYILEVTKCQSISQAAKNLFISQSTLSNIVSSFESDLGVTLFYRTNRGIRLTEMGTQIIPELQKILSHQNNIHTLTAFQHNKKSHVHITMYPIGEFSVMAHIWGAVYKQYPQSQLHLHTARPESIIKKMWYNGSVVGLGALSELRYNNICAEADHHGFVCQDIYRDPFYLYVGKNHRLAREKQIGFSSIVNESFVLPNNLVTPSENAFYSDFQKLNHITTFNHYEPIKKAIANHNFITIAPGLAFHQDIYCRCGEIVQIPLTGLREILINFCIYPKEEGRLSVLEHAVLTEIRAFFEQLPAD